ncbi:histidine phosphatase family protein [Microbacterium sp. HD4P20]|uniref:histidine phosphatase family protein n=1 Tax=Microbacterium sp. HD4P20 TaxID=2864874 RepID=UPI001C642271|nr:histidine phosphatase family protein [Microbacterium sp. HD4P20]MCP2636472.1 histidine phosphatase family protein [Microbacterium sp. HD4P20]
MAVKELWLVRHGESVGNVAATRAEIEGLEVIPLDARDADVPLSDTGREQSAALGEWLSDRRATIDAYWASPYLRARETLTLALDASGGETTVLVDERLRDRELGILDLLTRAGVARRHPDEMARRKHLGKFYHRPPGGESWADVALRLRSFLRDALGGPGESVMMVAHDAVVMLLLYVLLPLREEELLAFAGDHTVLNASVTHLVRGDAGWELVEFSGVAHLQREGADVTAHPGSPDVEPA